MSIQPIEHGSTRGFQVRIFRNGKVHTRFIAFKKHGGKRNAKRIAQKTERDLELCIGAELPSRKKGFHASKPNRNSQTNVAGIRAFYARGVLQFSSSWSNGPGNEIGRIQRSTGEHGLLGALSEVLNARHKGAGVPVPTPRKAWEYIKHAMNQKAP